MKNLKILIATVYPNTDGEQSWIGRIRGGMRIIHQADIIALHETGSGWTCQITKNRLSSEMPTMIIDDMLPWILKQIGKLPRKKKKELKKNINNQLNQYKNNY